jgi:hypothetical protein
VIEGRRVDSLDALEREGDYCTMQKDGAISSLWMILPRTGTRGRIAAVGHGTDEPEWEIDEGEGGRITVKPSIDEGEGGYHGFLTDGVWSDG